jgi:MFS family permease
MQSTPGWQDLQVAPITAKTVAGAAWAWASLRRVAAALRPLRLPGFPNLGLAYLVNELGNWLGEIALAILVYEQTGSTLATAALFLGMQFSPALLSPPIAARLESVPARRALPALYAAEAAAFGGLALLADDFVLVAVLALATFDGAIASAARALTRAAAAAALAPAGQLREGNALLNVAFTVGAAAGPALGGVIVAAASPQTALLADAASFLCVAVLLAAARRLPSPDYEPSERGWTRRLRLGMRYVRERIALRRLLGAQALAFVFFATVIPIEVAFAKDTLDAGDLGYGLLLTSWGIGMIAGSLLFATLREVRLAALLAVSTAAIAAAYLGTAVAPTLTVACVASVIGGTGNGVQWVALVTAVQELTRATYQTRVLALLEALASAMPGIGFLLGGVIASIFDPRASYAVAGAGVVLVLAAGGLALRRVEWRAELDQGAAAAASSLAAEQAVHAPLTRP